MKKTDTDLWWVKEVLQTKQQRLVKKCVFWINIFWINLNMDDWEDNMNAVEISICDLIIYELLCFIHPLVAQLGFSK